MVRKGFASEPRNNGWRFRALVLLGMAMLINAAVRFSPRHIDPQMPATVALQAAIPFGKTGLFLALAGMFFAFAGAAIETCLSVSYSVVSSLVGSGDAIGKGRGPFFYARMAADVWNSLAIVLTGIDPLELVEYAIVASIIVLPLTYLPMLLIANDSKYIGKCSVWQRGPCTCYHWNQHHREISEG